MKHWVSVTIQVPVETDHTSPSAIEKLAFLLAQNKLAQTGWMVSAARYK